MCYRLRALLSQYIVLLTNFIYMFLHLYMRGFTIQWKMKKTNWNKSIRQTFEHWIYHNYGTDAILLWITTLKQIQRHTQWKTDACNIAYGHSSATWMRTRKKCLTLHMLLSFFFDYISQKKYIRLWSTLNPCVRLQSTKHCCISMQK